MTKMRILLVDDNVAILEDFKTIFFGSLISKNQSLSQLEDILFNHTNKNQATSQPPPFQYIIDDAYQGDEAIAMVERAEQENFPYSLIFMDVRMPPGMDGLETITKIWEKFPYTEIVICTAYSDYSWEQILQKFGRTDHLLFMKKPFDSVAVKQITLAMTTKWELDRKNRDIMESLQKKTEELNTVNQELVQEISDRRKAQDKLGQVQNYTKSIINSMPSILIGLDATDRITYWNQEAEIQTGLSAPLAEGQNFLELDVNIIPLEDAIKEIKEKKTPIKIEKIKSLKNQQDAYWDVIVYPADQDLREGIVIRVDNVTERVLIENELVKLNETLEHHVEERTKELEDSLNQLKETQNHLVQAEKMASLGSLVAGVAHEINTPIGIGVTESSYLGDMTKDCFELFKSDELTKSAFEKFLKNTLKSSTSILRNLERAASLVASFKQVAVDQTFEEKRTFIIKQYINEVLTSLHTKIKRTKHSIVINCPENIAFHSYPGAFAQIITNLVMNSLIHGLEGIDNGEIVIDISIKEGHLVFSYLDNGKGMDDMALELIFEPFFTTKRNQGGTGLGMHIVFNLVTQKLKGQITCSSSIGHGTQFLIRLPYEEPIHTASLNI